MVSKNTVLKNFCQFGCLTLVLVLPILNFNTASAENKRSIDAGTLTTGISWGGSKLPYSQLVDIKDSLTDQVLGQGVLDRHGIGGIGAPFSSPEIGELVFISSWENLKDKGCFVQMVIQHAPKPDIRNLGTAKSMVPNLLELGIGSKKIELKELEKSDIVFPEQTYTYQHASGNGATYQTTETWYMASNLFALDSHSASILSNAPAKEVKARVTFDDGQTILMHIGPETVKAWSQVYKSQCANLAASKE